ncbi:DUF2142 domain-containing protein [Micromonospora sp. NBC_01796]|uniref:DUF2142 domain-containing protein n=1 Tax=Micromonospora sp. NBC_01796 TaxID=2975987 RepID=UPI002DD7ED5F|nr:DUF2142 domain-containing protein [Micromonospora sp. NBC_01796]WSA87503.1 DUF2142 domain-containing protein [Micromonospora sp. NBC_01796]
MHLPRLWSLAFAGFFLVITGWSLASPYNGNADEIAHIYRAYGVVSGDVFLKPEAASLGTGAFHKVPASLVKAADICWQMRPEVSAACAKAPDGRDLTPVEVGNPAGRYNPVYYAAVGLPLKIWPDMRGVMGVRLLTGLVAAALLAFAVVCIVRSRRPLLLGALLLGTSPIAINMAGAVNPNGVEIAAGILLFAAGLSVLAGPRDDRPPTWMLTLVVISAAILVSVRSGGPAWLALALGALLLPLRWANLRRLVVDRSLRIATLVVTVVSVLSVLWIVVMKASKLAGGTPAGFGPGQIMVHVVGRWPQLMDQMVGELGWLDVHLSGSAYVLWQLPAGALLLLAALVGSGVDRWRLLIVVGGAVGVASVLDAVNADATGGFVGQGRYLLPVLSGALLLAAWIITRGGTLTTGQTALAVRAIIVITVPIQLYALLVAEARYTRGIPPMASPASYNPLGGDWQPATGPIVPLIVTGVGLLVVAVLCWRLAAIEPAPPVHPEEEHNADRVRPTSGAGGSTGDTGAVPAVAPVAA